MHTVHLLALHYDLGESLNDQYVQGLVGSSIDDNPAWWDYYSVGGRWDGFFGDKGNFITYEESPAEVRKELVEARARQNAKFRSMRDELTGATVAVADISGHVFGLPVQPDEAAAERLTRSNKETQEAWQRVLRANDLDSLDTDFQAQMAMFRAQRLIGLVYGEWNPESSFYYPIGETTNPKAVESFLDQEERYGRGLLLAAIDFHF